MKLISETSSCIRPTIPIQPRGGGVLRSIFAWYVLLTSQKPYSIIVYSVANYIDPILVTFGQMVNV